MRAGSLRLRRRVFTPSEPVVMAVINRTPDSFSDGGTAYPFAAALAAVGQAVADGADIVDIGGVPAGPGAQVSVAEEIRRTAPLVAAARDRHPELVISVDTWRSEVAAAVVAEGADLLNDAWSGADPRLAEVAAQAGIGLVCAHTGGLAPRTIAVDPRYADVVADVMATTTRLAQRAVTLGVRRDAILVDPAPDLGKTPAQSLELIRRLSELVGTGWPVLAAVSRKDFVGAALGLPVDRRLEGTLATVAVCAWLGARVFRVHDVAAARRTVDMVAAIRATAGAAPPAAPPDRR